MYLDTVWLNAEYDFSSLLSIEVHIHYMYFKTFYHYITFLRRFVVIFVIFVRRKPNINMVFSKQYSLFLLT